MKHTTKRFLGLVLAAVLLLLASVPAMAEEEVRTVTFLAPYYSDASRPWFNNESWQDTYSGQALLKMLADHNLAIEIESIPKEQYNDAAKTRLLTNLDLPDVVSCPLGDADTVNLGASGVIMNVTELLETYDEDGSIMEYMKNSTPTALNTIKDANGNLWWFYYPYYTGFDNGSYGSAFTISIREDWLKNVGLEYKTFYTPDEFLEVLVQLQEGDANGNGIADEVLGFNPCSFGSNQQGIAAGFGIGEGIIYVLNDLSGVQCALDHENFPAYIEYVQRLYEAGVFNTEILNSGNNVVNSNRASAIYSYNAETWFESGIAGYEDTAIYSPIILDDDAGENGFMIQARDNLDAAYSKYVVTTSCKDPQAVVDLMDLIYTDEYNLLCYWGVEGLCFEYDENGLPVYIDSQDEHYAEGSKTVQPFLYARAFIPNVYVWSYTYDSWMSEQYCEGYDTKNEFLDYLWDNDYKCTYTPRALPYAMKTDEEREIWNQYSSNVDTYISELILDLVMGEKSLDDLPSYRAELTELGLDEMIAIATAQFERFIAE